MPIDIVFKKPEHIGMTLSEYRKEHGLSLEEFGRLVGKSKGHIHAIEQNNRATAKLALAIERETDGQVSAAFLNSEIAEARKAAA
jgi:transcriptional regulator with XRE-family HTH domain